MHPPHWLAALRHSVQPDGFMATLGHLERLFGDRSRIGDINYAERIRLHHSPSFAFPTSDVAQVTHTGGETVVSTTFLGLTGSATPLPEYLVETVVRDDASGLQRFFDLWQHRLLALLYRLMSKYSYSREFSQSGDDRWSERLAGWSSQAHDTLPMWLRLRWAPLLLRKALGASALTTMLADLLEPVMPRTAVRLQPLTGGWEPLSPDQHSQLGRRNHTLGQSLVLGQHVDARASACTVTLGPLDADAYVRLQADVALGQQIGAVLTMGAPPGLNTRVNMWVTPEALPAWRLSITSVQRLGENTWLGRPPNAIYQRFRIPEVSHAA